MYSGTRHRTFLIGAISVMTLTSITGCQAPGKVRKEVPERSTIDAEYQWDLSVMYDSAETWEQDHEMISAMVDQLAALKGTCGQSPENLSRVLTLRDRIDIQLEKLSAYSTMRFHEDMRQSETQALEQRAKTLATEYGQAVSWLEPELISIPEETIRSWLQSADLQVYGHYFDNLLRTKEHILSPREEELLAMASKATGASGDTFGLLLNAELKLRKVKDRDGNEIEVSPGVFYGKMYSKDCSLRRDVYLGFMHSFLEIQNSLASTLAGTVERDWFYAKARGYNTCLEASLDAENLPVSVYHNLIKTVNDHLHLLHRFTRLKKQYLNLDEIHPYDLYVTLVDLPEEKKYTYPQGCEIVMKGLEPLGQEYVDTMQMGLNARWVDVYENKGKKSGAYNMGTYLSPPYVLLNFNGTYNDVSTVAHEMGHAMQSYFTQKSQPPVYNGYPMFTAEVASTAAEIVFKQSLMQKTSDPRERTWMIHTMLENIRTTVFRQTKFAEFDLAIHEMVEKGEPLTADSLMKLSREIFQKYYGPELVLDAEADVECLRIPHYYLNFYVYRYATSYSAASALAKRIMDAEPGAGDDFMKFLTIGNSMYAIDMLKVAGVDMTTPKPVADCMVLFARLLDELEKLLAQQA